MSNTGFEPNSLDYRVLTVLGAQLTAIGSFQIYGQLPDARAAAIEESIKRLREAGMIERARFSDCERYSIAQAGKDLLRAVDSIQPLNTRMKTVVDAVSSVADTLHGKSGVDPLQVTICRREEPPSRATVLLCVDENELDDWWESLDTELKADAFVRFALHIYDDDCHLYIERTEPSIPVVGTIGDQEAPGTNATAVEDQAVQS